LKRWNLYFINYKNLKIGGINMKIDHVAIYVNNLEKTKEFYVKYFQAKANEKYHNKNTGLQTYFLSFPDSETRLEIMTRPELSARKDRVMNEGFIHLAFSVGSKEKVDELTEGLVKDGFRCLSGPRTTGDGYYESVVEDCEGNLLEITE
jgi:glyoxalase family protein